MGRCRRKAYASPLLAYAMLLSLTLLSLLLATTFATGATIIGPDLTIINLGDLVGFNVKYGEIPPPFMVFCSGTEPFSIVTPTPAITGWADVAEPLAYAMGVSPTITSTLVASSSTSTSAQFYIQLPTPNSPGKVKVSIACHDSTGDSNYIDIPVTISLYGLLGARTVTPPPFVVYDPLGHCGTLTITSTTMNDPVADTPTPILLPPYSAANWTVVPAAGNYSVTVATPITPGNGKMKFTCSGDGSIGGRSQDVYYAVDIRVISGQADGVTILAVCTNSDTDDISVDAEAELVPTTNVFSGTARRAADTSGIQSVSLSQMRYITIRPQTAGFFGTLTFQIKCSMNSGFPEYYRSRLIVTLSDGLFSNPISSHH
jgi:hypothetical protein